MHAEKAPGSTVGEKVSRFVVTLPLNEQLALAREYERLFSRVPVHEREHLPNIIELVEKILDQSIYKR